MLNKILIANRGEIAVRIIKACREMGITSVAVFSTADKSALHTQLADEAVCIGPPKSKDSYLNMQNIISAAVMTKSQAIHPGFGFLSENALFASMCKECNITFIGPDAKTIDIMGNKVNARDVMISAGIPVIKGCEGVLKSLEDAYGKAEYLEYPVMLKAASGGGGKGIRIIRNKEQMEKAYNMAKAEAKVSFNDDSLYIEKYIENAKHIEVQILGDNFGNIIHLGERDCSIQRNNQKILEEAPSIAISESTRQEMGEVAVKAAKSVNYKGAGTIEFLYDRHKNFYFMEMNTRVQVEHPITEMITGIDIVKEQIRIASGKKLSVKQEDVFINGHSIECRVNAESPKNNFAPSPGKLEYFLAPSGGLGLRVDSAVYSEYVIPPFYDSMIAKVITHGRDREEAISKMKRALLEFVIEGVETNIDFQLDILENKKYLDGDFNTSFIATEILKNM